MNYLNVFDSLHNTHLGDSSQVKQAIWPSGKNVLPFFKLVGEPGRVALPIFQGKSWQGHRWLVLAIWRCLLMGGQVICTCWVSVKGQKKTAHKNMIQPHFCHKKAVCTWSNKLLRLKM